MNQIILSNEEAHLRLDKLLAEKFPAHSRTYFQFLIEQGAILLNGKTIKKRETGQVGDTLAISFLTTPDSALEPEPIALDILYEDDDLLCINKPAGMVVHPAFGHPNGTLVNALLHHCKGLIASSDKVRPGIVHRLDKETSGVIIAAKTERAHRELVALFAKRAIKKWYRAICFGNPGNCTIDAPIGRNPKRRKEMAVIETGKPALSRCRVLEEKPPFSHVEVELVSGRTHQIRVHLQHVGAPIVGDPLYGNAKVNKKYQVPHQLLHAHRLELIHPVTSVPLIIEAPLPALMIKFIDSYI